MANESALIGLAHENVWCDHSEHEDAEMEYQQYIAQQSCGQSVNCTSNTSQKSCISSEIAKARDHIKQSLQSNMADSSCDSILSDRISNLEAENKDLLQVSKKLEALVQKLAGRISVLEKGCSIATGSTCITGPVTRDSECTAEDNNEEEDDFELFGDDNEEDDAEAERLKQERVKAYEDKKAKKPVLIAKSNIILDVKPWDDETDMVELEKCVRSIEMDGLLWGSSKLVPLAYTIKKLQISCVVEDDKVSVDDLEEKITAFEDYVQSIDIAAFNKI
jgi:elongation factor 1-delta